MGIRTRRARKHSKTHAVGFGIAGVLGFMALLVIAIFASLGGLIDIWLQDLPDYKSADAYLVAEPTEIYDASGQVIADYYLQNRRSITIDEVSPYVLEGTVDTEDVRFYQHNGVDPQGIARAIVVVLKGGHEGASTITQQLVRNTVLSNEQFEKSIKRKVREAYIATEMEKIYTKEQILMMYLNTIYYGHGAYGIEAASITYFDKHAKDLTLPEAALLSGLPQSPSYYDPFQNPEDAKTRRNVVLSRMLTVGDITQEQYDEAVQAPVEIREGSASPEASGSYPYFTKYVKSILEKDFDNATIMQGGLRIYTTIDPKCQKAAEESVESTLSSLNIPHLEQAAVVIDPKTGYIKAMVGGRQFDENHQFNLATQAKRQPGSSFKPFTLAAAINDGMNPNIILNCNSPITIGNGFKVPNYGNISYGYISLQYATAISSNTGYVQVAHAIGNDKVATMAKELGIKEDLPTYDSLTLGVVEIPPIQMCEAYATLADQGVHHDAVAITKIEDRNGNIVYEHKDSPKEVISPEVAGAVTNVLKTVVSQGTARVINNYGVGQPIAGKTGTTDNTRDLWFSGYTPQYAITVWTGYRDNRTVRINGRNAHPSDTSCVTFGKMAKALCEGMEYQDFPTTQTPTYKPNSSWTFEATSASTNAPKPIQAPVAPPAAKTEPEEKPDENTKPKDEDKKPGKDKDPQKPGGDGAGGAGGQGGNGGNGADGGGEKPKPDKPDKPNKPNKPEEKPKPGKNK